MKFKIIVSTIALCFVAACGATTGTSSTKLSGPPNSASKEEVLQGFMDVVSYYCTLSIQNKKTISELAAIPNAPVSLEKPSARRSGSVPSGSEAWVVSGLGEIVMLEHSGVKCRASAYGLPVKGTFDAIAALVANPNGYVEQEMPEMLKRKSPLEFNRGFKKTLDGIEYSIFLSGNEPGAPGTMSRFSTLIASVGKKAIEESTNE